MLKNKLALLTLAVAALLVAGLWLANEKLREKEEQATSPQQIFPGANPQIKTLEVGQKAPEFAVQTIDGENLTLTDFRDTILVVTSGAAWCPTCIIEAKNFNPVFEEFKGRGVQFMTVDIDPRDDETAVAEFQRRYAPWHNVYSGDAQEMIKDYGFWRFEITYIIDKEGVVRFADVAITDTEVLRNELNEVFHD